MKHRVHSFIRSRPGTPRTWSPVAVLCLLFGVALLAGACAGTPGNALEEQPQSADLETGLYNGPPVEAAPHPFGVKWRWDLIGEIEEDVIEVAGGASYAEIEWCEIEREPGERDWESTDEVVESTARIGYEPLLKIRVGTCWATGDPDVTRSESTARASRMPVDIEAYKVFVADTVTRYSQEGVRAYAIESEANLRTFWRASAADYELLLRSASEAVRAADPSAKVLDSGLSSTVYGALVAEQLLARSRPERAVAFWNTFYERWFELEDFDLAEVDDVDELRHELDATRSRRARAFFGATKRAADSIDAYNLRFFEEWQRLRRVVRFVETELPGKDVETWGIGIVWPGDDFDEEEARIETAKLLATGSVLDIAPMIWQPGANEAEWLTEEPEVFRALWRAPGLKFPTGQAFEVMVEAARGEDVKTREVDGMELRGVAYGHQSDTDIVVWSDDAPVLLRGEKPEQVEVLDLAGEEIEWNETGLLISREPVVITVDRRVGKAVSMILKREAPRDDSAF